MSGSGTAPAAAPRVVIVGAGIAGLALAHELRRIAREERREIAIRVLERSERPGGNIRTEDAEGFLCEWGPNGFLDNVPETLALISRLGIRDRLQVSEDAARRRFIFRRGRLRQLPEGILPFLRSGLLSWPGKLRIAAEPFAQARRDDDETIHDFAARRIGREAAEVLIASMVSGIFAGDSRKLSLAACFPKMRKMEDEHGGLFRAMLALRRKKREGVGLGALAPVSGPRPGEGAGGPPPRKPAAQDSAMGMPAGKLTSFRGGMEDLIRALALALDGIVETQRPVAELLAPSRSGADSVSGGYTLTLEGGGSVEADVVVLASGAPASARAVHTFDSELAGLLHGIESAPLVVVCLGYETRSLDASVEGFGFLVPPREGPRILGALWDSSIYPGRAPAGRTLIRAMIGGARDAGAMALSDEKLLATVRADLTATMGLRAAPSFVRIFRHPLGIPQYTVGHLHRLTRIDMRLKDHPGLFVAGNAYRGVSINSCVAEAPPLARRIVRYLAPATPRRPGSAAEAEDSTGAVLR